MYTVAISASHVCPILFLLGEDGEIYLVPEGQVGRVLLSLTAEQENRLRENLEPIRKGSDHG